MVNLCVTVRNRYDMIRAMLLSAFEGTVKPDHVYIIDNGKCPGLLIPELEGIPSWTMVDISADPEPGQSCWSLARSLNWFMTQVPEERVIAHDDLTFAPHSIEKFISTPGAFLLDTALGVLTYRDECIRAVGLNDETISPGFYRYEDCDYQHRLALAGIRCTLVECGIRHTPNGTMRKYTDEEMQDYLHRQHQAAVNYHNKWGKGPERDPETGQWW